MNITAGQHTFLTCFLLPGRYPTRSFLAKSSMDMKVRKQCKLSTPLVCDHFC